MLGTIYFIVQSWGGVPWIRSHITQYFISKTSDIVQFNQIYSVFVNTISREFFEAVYDKATKDAHGFLYMDVVPNEP